MTEQTFEKWPVSLQDLGRSIPATFPPWLGEATEAIRDLAALPPNWDSYGATPVAPEVAARAAELLIGLVQPETPRPAVVPTVRGGVQIEWHVQGVDLEIDVLSSEQLRRFLGGPDFRRKLGTGVDVLGPRAPSADGRPAHRQINGGHSLAESRMADTEPPDDLTVPNDAVLWRRIPPRHLVDDQNQGGVRPSSAAFEDSPDGSPMSAALASGCGGAQDVLTGHEGFGLVAFSAGFIREQGLRIVRDPQPEEPWHVLIVGNKTRGLRKQLTRNATWVVLPTEPPSSPNTPS